jgi:hypothetical protein
LAVGGGITHTFVPDSTFVLDGFAIRAAGAPTTGLLYLYSDPGLIGGTDADGFVNAGPDSGRFAQTLIDGLPYTFFGTDSRTFLVFDLEGEGEIVLQEGVQYAIDLRNTDPESDTMFWMRTSVEPLNPYLPGNIYARNPIEVGDESERFDVGGGRRDGALALYSLLPAAAAGLLWRNNLNTNFNLNGNGDETGASANTVDEADYLYWRRYYGTSAAGGGAGAGGLSSAVPEPTTIALGLLAVGLGAAMRKR